MTEGTLCESTNAGRYALNDAEHGPDITSGQVLDIWLNGEWIPGRIEGNTYNYYFLAQKGGVCGLCDGLRVRLH